MLSAHPVHPGAERHWLQPHLREPEAFALCPDELARLTDAGARVSISTVGTSYDHAKAERYFETHKLSLNLDDSFAEAEVNRVHVIDAISNTKRLQSHLGYRPPVEFEALEAGFVPS